MIYGIGIDIQSISQIEKICARQNEIFLKKVFTAEEIAYCQKHRNPIQHLAARWAVKEAFMKAMGTGIGSGYRLCDVETINLPSGKPHVVLYGKALEDCTGRGLRIFVSISHSDDYAIGQVVLGIGGENEE